MATWEGPYLDLTKSLSAIITDVQRADPLAIMVQQQLEVVAVGLPGW